MIFNLHNIWRRARHIIRKSQSMVKQSLQRNDAVTQKHTTNTGTNRQKRNADRVKPGRFDRSRALHDETPGDRTANGVVSLTPSEVEKCARSHTVSIIHLARRSMEPETRTIEVYENDQIRLLTVTRQGIGPLLTHEGTFWEFKFIVSDEWTEYSVIVKSDLRSDDFSPIFRDPDRILLRIDSGCETGQLFGDLTCECRDQLKRAMSAIEEAGEGLIICIPHQDGRGKNSIFKLASLWLQTKLGLNTVEAASLLAEGEPIDVRTFGGAIAILKFLGCSDLTRLAVMTNNPKKLQIFSENSLPCELVPHVVKATEHTRLHLQAKGRCLGHTSLLQDESVDLRSHPDHPHEAMS